MKGRKITKENESLSSKQIKPATSTTAASLFKHRSGMEHLLQQFSDPASSDSSSELEKVICLPMCPEVLIFVKSICFESPKIELPDK